MWTRVWENMQIHSKHWWIADSSLWICEERKQNREKGFDCLFALWQLQAATTHKCTQTQQKHCRAKKDWEERRVERREMSEKLFPSMCHVCVCVFQTDIKCELVCVRLLSRQSRSCFLGEEVLKQDYIQDHRELVTIIPPLYELFMKIFLFIFYPQIWECICFGWAKWQWKINLDTRHKERRKTVRLPKTALLITLFCQLV